MKDRRKNQITSDRIGSDFPIGQSSPRNDENFKGRIKDRFTGGACVADDPGEQANSSEKAARPRGGRRRPLLHPLVSPLRAVDLSLSLPLFPLRRRRRRLSQILPLVAVARLRSSEDSPRATPIVAFCDGTSSSRARFRLASRSTLTSQCFTLYRFFPLGCSRLLPPVS